MKVPIRNSTLKKKDLDFIEKVLRSFFEETPIYPVAAFYRIILKADI